MTPKKKANAKAAKAERARWGEAKGIKPARDESFKAWIRTLPCVICQVTKGVEAAHVGPHGLGVKASDYQCVPLCGGHHRTLQASLHNVGPVVFWKAWRLDRDAVIERLQALYAKEKLS